MGIDAWKTGLHAFFLTIVSRGFLFASSHVSHLPWNCIQLVQRSEELAMKTFEMQRLKGIQFLKWGKKLGNTGSVVALVSLERKEPSGGCSASYMVMQLFWKLKSLWKQALGWQRMNVQYSYDIHSYSLNFDDGSFHDHCLPNTWRYIFFFLQLQE